MQIHVHVSIKLAIYVSQTEKRNYEECKENMEKHININMQIKMYNKAT